MTILSISSLYRILFGAAIGLRPIRLARAAIAYAAQIYVYFGVPVVMAVVAAEPEAAAPTMAAASAADTDTT